MRVEPLEHGRGFEFVNEVSGGAISGPFIVSAEKGIRDALEHGPIGGYPVQDVRVIIYDGKTHAVDSKDIAFRIAGKYAFLAALQKARPALLEPMVTLEVVVPESHLGSATGDLNGRRGRVNATDLLPGGMAAIHATAPLSELGQYDNQLRSATSGQGSFSMEFSHYETVPPMIQAKISAQYQAPVEE